MTWNYYTTENTMSWINVIRLLQSCLWLSDNVYYGQHKHQIFCTVKPVLSQYRLALWQRWSEKTTGGSSLQVEFSKYYHSCVVTMLTSHWSNKTGLIVLVYDLNAHASNGTDHMPYLEGPELSHKLEGYLFAALTVSVWQTHQRPLTGRYLYMVNPVNSHFESIWMFSLTRSLQHISLMGIGI